MIPKKKVVSSFLATSLLVTPFLGTSVSAATTFSDIDSSYARDAILTLLEKGILSGAGDSEFHPTERMMRQDFAIILAKVLNLDVSNPPAVPRFSDVPAGHYAYAYVEAAGKEGLISGVGNENLGVNQPLTREQMVVLFVRALGMDAKGKGSEITFSDQDQISSWARDGVAAAVEAGLVSGIGNNTFNPKGVAQRQEVALVVERFLRMKEEQEKMKTMLPVISITPYPDKTTLESITVTGAVTYAAALRIGTTKIKIEDGKWSTKVPLKLGENKYELHAQNIAGKETIATVKIIRLPVSAGGSGGSGGGGQQDTVTATLVSTSPVTIGENVVAKSNKPGTLYLVPSTEKPANKEDLEKLVASKVARKAEASTANQNTNISTVGMRETETSYVVYAVDAANTVSKPTTRIVLQYGCRILGDLYLGKYADTKGDTKITINKGGAPLYTAKYKQSGETTIGTYGLEDGDGKLSYYFEVPQGTYTITATNGNRSIQWTVTTNTHELNEDGRLYINQVEDRNLEDIDDSKMTAKITFTGGPNVPESTTQVNVSDLQDGHILYASDPGYRPSENPGEGKLYEGNMKDIYDIPWSNSTYEIENVHPHYHISVIEVDEEGNIIAYRDYEITNDQMGTKIPVDESHVDEYVSEGDVPGEIIVKKPLPNARHGSIVVLVRAATPADAVSIATNQKTVSDIYNNILVGNENIWNAKGITESVLTGALPATIPTTLRGTDRDVYALWVDVEMPDKSQVMRMFKVEKWNTTP
ncbi:S-layer family protein [Aneurinibacillus soli]|uniref:Endo-1,4-beta-xylanase A n=1 Tax=Aneurinibacillus soli TaxID=1500254 RepID=A0A0U4NI84_9BACL|nr:S-layer homology domain-containing protein [Aneurinibacillus soli]PYE61690.1 S-layer family protein [Aneurinibacillus soli]BAU28452.1 Endo-1,4-beta-xylanase A precursor [Aneurinibacillus soli]